MTYEWGSLLFSSPHRLDVLGELEAPGADTRELTDELSISRVTVQRHVNAFADKDWVEKRDGHYRRTVVGDRVYEAATAYLERLSILESHDDVIRSLAGVGESFDPLLLADATVSVADVSAPHEPITHYREAIASCSTATVRGILPAFSELYAEAHADLLEEGVETELIVPEPVLEMAPPEPGTPPSLFSLYVVDYPLKFALTVTDDAAFVGGYVDGRFVCCVESHAPAAIDWAAECFERHRTRATPVPLQAEFEVSSDEL